MSTRIFDNRLSDHSETLGTIRIQSNDESFYDPRPKRAILNTTIPSDVPSRFGEGRPKRAILNTTIPSDVPSRFGEGQASIRAVAEGHSRFLRVPPPNVRAPIITLSPLS